MTEVKEITISIDKEKQAQPAKDPVDKTTPTPATKVYSILRIIAEVCLILTIGALIFAVFSLHQQNAKLQQLHSQILDQTGSIIIDYSPETYPRINWNTNIFDVGNGSFEWIPYAIYKSLPPFEFTDTQFECYSCEYKEQKQLENGDIYLGQWKGGEPNGRGVNYVKSENAIWEGYFQEGVLVGKRRKISDSEKVTAWDEGGEKKVILCKFEDENYTCDVKKE